MPLSKVTPVRPFAFGSGVKSAKRGLTVASKPCTLVVQRSSKKPTQVRQSVSLAKSGPHLADVSCALRFISPLCHYLRRQPSTPASIESELPPSFGWRQTVVKPLFLSSEESRDCKPKSYTWGCASRKSSAYNIIIRCCN